MGNLPHMPVAAGVFCEPSAVLSNSVLIDNSANDEGGGAYAGTFYNCVLIYNSARNFGGGADAATLHSCALIDNWAGNGGGTHYSTLYNSVLTGNSANQGGGASGGALYNCTLIGNSVSGDFGYGGGTYEGMLYNCIVYYNTATNGPNFYSGTLNYCCTTPDPGGVGNITNDPLFNYAGGNLRLQSNSPCVNTGINQDWMAGSTDLDGNPRIRRSRVDMGAYESDDWGQFSDVDGDGLSDWIEVYRTGTDPTNAASFLGMWTPLDSDGTSAGIVVRWQSTTDKTYLMERATNLMEALLH